MRPRDAIIVINLRRRERKRPTADLSAAASPRPSARISTFSLPSTPPHPKNTHFLEGKLKKKKAF